MEKFELPHNLENKEFLEAPEGWKTTNGVVSETGYHNKLVKKTAEKYRSTNKEYFHLYKDVMGKVREHYSPELITIITQEIETELEKTKGIPEAPEGWKTMEQLAKDLERTTKPIKRVVNRYRETNDSYFAEHKVKMGNFEHVYEHYSPELVKLVTEELQRHEKAPDGWETNDAVATELGVAPLTITRIANTYREKYPKYFSDYRLKKFGTVQEHYSPDLILLIKEDLQSRKAPPDGWIMASAIASDLDIQLGTLENYASKYIKENEEYAGEYKNNNNQISRYYSPGLIEILRKEICAIESAPEGWKTKSSIGKELEIDPNVVKKEADKYRKSNPDYFGNYKDSVGKNAEHYSPELISIVSKEIKKVIKAPDGWYTNWSLAFNFGVDHYTIKKIADKYRDQKEYFKLYRDKRNRPFEHYSPELVEKITTEIEKRNKEKLEKNKYALEHQQAPENWQTTQGISEKTGISHEEVEKMAKKLRQKYQGQYGKFKDKKTE